MIRLYELDDNPDRRLFLDKLLHYMEERGTPLTQCPTISKQPLDLYRLYHYTKERGGYLEVRVLYKTIYIIYTVEIKIKTKLFQHTSQLKISIVISVHKK